MSRVAKSPVELPKEIEVNIAGRKIIVKGSLGLLEMSIHPSVKINQKDSVLTFSALDGSKLARAMSGTTRALVNNMVFGVSRGFEKRLKLVGIGYRAQSKGKRLTLTLGYSHPVEYDLPEGISAETPSQTEIVLKGIDKQLVGQAAAEIRNFRRPEPYKGKGVCYADEQVHRKEAKKK